MQNLLVKYLSGVIIKKDRNKLAEWLKFKDNRKRFENLKTLWHLMDDYKADFEPNTNIAWEKTDERIQKAKTRKLYVRTISSIAASLLILLGLWSLLRSTEDIVTIYANANQTKQIVLPDSSKVYLKKGGTLSYNTEFEKRIVKLKGEAFFEVTRRNRAQFKVEGGITEVVVLGTSFNYRTDSLTDEDELHVFTGKVQFSDKKAKQNKVVLTKGSTARLVENKIKKSEFEGSNILFYKTGKLSFTNNTLQEFATTVSQCYKQEIIIKNENLKSIEINTGFDNASLDEIMDEIRIITGLNIEQKQDIWIISE